MRLLITFSVLVGAFYSAVYAALPVAQLYPVWVQYTIADGVIQATNSQRVSDDVLSTIGRAQIEYNGDPNCMMVDIMKNPPVVIPDPNCQ